MEDEFDDFLGRIEPMTPQEQQEELLRYFVALIDGMPAQEVAALRAHFLRRFPAGKEQDTFTQVIDGHLALREIARTLSPPHKRDARFDPRLS